MATRKNRVEVVQFLLSNNADINYLSEEQFTPLYIASYWGKKYLESLFLWVPCTISYLIAFSNNNETGHLDLVQLLLERGALLEHAGSKKATPLYGASREGLYIFLSIVGCAVEIT